MRASLSPIGGSWRAIAGTLLGSDPQAALEHIRVIDPVIARRVEELIRDAVPITEVAKKARDWLLQ
jgi:hypothetical protein